MVDLRGHGDALGRQLCALDPAFVRGYKVWLPHGPDGTPQRLYLTMARGSRGPPPVVYIDLTSREVVASGGCPDLAYHHKLEAWTENTRRILDSWCVPGT